MSNYYIATDGNDGGAGTESDPWATLSHAVSNSSGGDTIYAEAGTYTFEEIAWGGQNLVGEDMETTIFDGSDADVKWSGNNDISDITVKNVVRTGDYGYIINGLNHNSVSRCRFMDLTITGTHKDTGVFRAAGLSGAITVTACVFANITSADGGPLMSSNQYQTGIAFNIYNCSFYITDNIGTLLTKRTRWQDAIIKNCIFEVTDTFELLDEGAGDVLEYNYYNAALSHAADAHEVTGDVDFVDAASGDLRLKPTSDMIDAGTLI